MGLWPGAQVGAGLAAVRKSLGQDTIDVHTFHRPGTHGDALAVGRVLRHLKLHLLCDEHMEERGFLGIVAAWLI